MNLLCLDLELNQPSGKVIEVGALVFKSNDKGKLQIVDEMQVFVNPLEPIAMDITLLTGITNVDVARGTSVYEAYLDLRNMHKKHKCFKNCLVWGSGAYSDSSHLWDQVVSEGHLPSMLLEEGNTFGRRVLDVKTLYQSRQIINGKTVKGGLSVACKELELDFIGEPHRAKPDAINTARVFLELMKKDVAK